VIQTGLWSLFGGVRALLSRFAPPFDDDHGILSSTLLLLSPPSLLWCVALGQQ